MRPSLTTRAELPFEPPYDRRAALRLLAAHAVPGAEVVDLIAGSYRRLFPTPLGAVSATLQLLPDRVIVQADADPSATSALLPAVRALLDLDADPAAIAAKFADDDRIGPLVAARPGLRVMGHPSGWEAAVTTILGQQVSLAAARTFAGRLLARFGDDHPSGLTSFPSSEVVAGADPEQLRAAMGITTGRSATIQRTAEAFADGLVVAPDSDHGEARRRLLAIPGIGPWTVDYLAVRALGDRDAFPSGDLVLRRALGDVDTKTALAMSQPWRPLRAYALLQLWTSFAPSLA